MHSATSRSAGLHIDVTGDGPPLVLLHGWGMHGGVFAPLVAQLRSHFRLHVVDLPGHGYSSGSDAPLRLDGCAYAIARVVPADGIWCGWSLGGLIALQAALTHPQRVGGLVLICASPRFARGDDWRYGMSPEILRDFADGLRTEHRATLNRFIALEAFGSADARADIRTLCARLFERGEPCAQALAAGLDVLERSDLRSDLPRLKVPSLWLAGRRDRLVDPRAMREAAALAPDAAFEVIGQAGHAPFLSDPQAVAASHVAFAHRLQVGTDPGERP